MAWMARQMKVLASPKEGVVIMELCPLWTSCLGCAYVPVEGVEHANIVRSHAVFHLHLFFSLFWGFTLCIWGTLSGTRTNRVVPTPPGSAMGMWAPVGWPAQVAAVVIARERSTSRWCWAHGWLESNRVVHGSLDPLCWCIIHRSSKPLGPDSLKIFWSSCCHLILYLREARRVPDSYCWTLICRTFIHRHMQKPQSLKCPFLQESMEWPLIQIKKEPLIIRK